MRAEKRSDQLFSEPRKTQQGGTDVGTELQESTAEEAGMQRGHGQISAEKCPESGEEKAGYQKHQKGNSLHSAAEGGSIYPAETVPSWETTQSDSARDAQMEDALRARTTEAGQKSRQHAAVWRGSRQSFSIGLPPAHRAHVRKAQHAEHHLEMFPTGDDHLSQGKIPVLRSRGRAAEMKGSPCAALVKTAPKVDAQHPEFPF